MGWTNPQNETVSRPPMKLLPTQSTGCFLRKMPIGDTAGSVEGALVQGGFLICACIMTISGAADWTGGKVMEG